LSGFYFADTIHEPVGTELDERPAQHDRTG
jgi:hypothetical protein